MKFLAFLFAILLATMPLLNAQNLDPSFYSDLETEFGAIKKNKFGAYDELLAHDMEGGFFTEEMIKRPSIFNLQGKYVVRYYNAQYQRMNEYPIAAEGEKFVTLFDFHRYKDQYYMFTERSSWQDKINEVRLQVIGKDKKPIEETKVINSMSLKANDRGNINKISSSSSRWSSPLSRAGYTLIKSRLGAKVMLFKNYTYDYVGSADKTEHYQLTMLDAGNNMNEAWKISVDMPYESQFFEILDGCTDEEGNFYMVGVIFEGKSRKITRDGFPNYTFKVFKYNQEGKVFEADIKLEDKFVTDLKIDIASQGQLVCTGFYSNDKRTTSVNGVYYLSLDAQNGQISKQSSKEFELDMLMENLSENQAKKVQRKAAKGKDLSLYQFYFDELIPRSDGGAIIIAEQYYSYTVTSTSTSSTGATTTRTTTYYVYKDILVINVNPEGEIEWAHKIHKLQKTANDGGYWSSYARINSGKELLFIFNDNGKNTPDKSTKDYKYFVGPNKKSMVAVAGIDQKGEINRKLLFKSRNKETILCPNEFLQIGPKTVLMLSIKKKKQQYVKLTFK